MIRLVWLALVLFVIGLGCGEAARDDPDPETVKREMEKLKGERARERKK